MNRAFASWYQSLVRSQYARFRAAWLAQFVATIGHGTNLPLLERARQLSVWKTPRDPIFQEREGQRWHASLWP